MPYQLKGRNVLVTGGSRGLGALICEKFAQEGCNIVVNYNLSPDRAKEVAEKCRGYGVKVGVVQGDAGIAKDNARLVQETVDILGGLDIIVANAGWTRFSNFADLNALSDEEWNKCWATNVMAHLQLLQKAGPIFKENPEGGVYLITSSVAGTNPGGSSMAYSVTKAAALHLMRCIAFSQGPKVRINAVLPGLLLTEWGKKYGPDLISGLKERAALKDVTNLDDCADAFVATAKNGSMTGRQITVDAGLYI